MRTSLGRSGAVVGTVAGVVLVAATGVALVRDSSVRLAGAEQVADPSGEGLGFVDDGPDVAGRPVSDARMGAASDLAAGDGSLYVLFDGLDDLVEGVLQVAPDGVIERGGMAPLVSRAVMPPDPITAVTLGHEGEVAVSYGDAVDVVGFDMAFSPQEPRLDVVPEVRFEVGAVGIAGRFELLVGSAERGEIDVVTQSAEQGDVEVRRLLGRPDDRDAAVRSDQDLGPIVAIAPLGDERVAFVADGDDGERRLYLIDGGGVAAVDTGEVNPVAADGVDTSELPRRDRWPMAPISASPDGGIVAVGEHEGRPRITLVDPESGEVEVLADLEGVEPTVEERVSAAIVGDDLFFLAEGSLWRKDGVLP
jgi:hypothetical protein